MSEFLIDRTGIYDSRFVYGKENGWQTSNRKVVYYEIEIFSEDGGIAFINDHGYPIRKGHALVSKPGELRHSELHFRAHYLHIKSDRPETTGLLDSLPSYFEITSLGKYTDIISCLAVASWQEFDGKDLYLCSKIYELLFLLLSDAKRAVRSPESTDAMRMLDAKKFIDENFSRNIKLADIAASVNLSPIYFHGRFREFAGVTPHEYLCDVRLSEAKNHLSFSDMPPDEIARVCGFSSRSYFNAFFKEKTGMTPTAFRNAERTKYDP